MKEPGEYRWSSFQHNIGQRQISFVTEHSVFSNLADSQIDGAKAYAKFFQDDLACDVLKKIRDCTQSGMPLGHDRFREKIEQRLSHKLGEVGRGRPKRVLTP